MLLSLLQLVRHPQGDLGANEGDLLRADTKLRAAAGVRRTIVHCVLIGLSLLNTTLKISIYLTADLERTGASLNSVDVKLYARNLVKFVIRTGLILSRGVYQGRHGVSKPWIILNLYFMEWSRDARTECLGIRHGERDLVFSRNASGY